MKKNIITLTFAFALALGMASCLKSNDLYTDFASTQPTADITKAPGNALLAAAPTASWFTLSTTPGGVDYKTAVHISSKDHLGDVTLNMKIDKAAAATWITAHPAGGYEVIPDSLFTVPSLTVTIKNAGVFSVGDFVVHLKTDTKDGGGNYVFKTHKFILPVKIESVASANYTVASNFQYILWYIKVS